MERKVSKYTSDLTQNWNGSIATKLTAIILWSVIITVFVLTAPIMLNYESQKLKEYLWNNQHLVNLIDNSVRNQDSKSDIENKLQFYIDGGIAGYISVKSTDLDISLGFPSDKNYRFPTTRLVTESNQPIVIEIEHPDLKRAVVIERIILGVSTLLGATLFGLFMFLVTQQVVHKPMTRFIELTRRLSSGEKEVRFDEGREDEFGELAQFSNQMINNLEFQRLELLDTNRELISEVRNREVALAASQQKSAFLANMSHEIRTPLSSIIGYTERLRYKKLKTEEEKNKMMDVVLQSSSHLMSLINNILDFSKIEANKLEVEAKEFSIVNIVNHVANLLREKAMDQSTEIKVEYEFPMPKFIYNDSLRTKQILLNLVSNALRFTQNGTITICVSFDRYNNQLVVAVKDTGIGMTESVQRSLFKPFSQGERVEKDGYAGTGLGLVISKKLADLMGGDISVESKKDIGSTFTFRIDAGFELGQDIINKIDITAFEQFQYNKPDEGLKLLGKVLLVEDTVEIRELIKAYLEDYGVEITTAINGKLGVELALDGAFDVVIMDIQMPVMNGKEAIKMLRDNGYAGPVLALTADAFAQQIEEYKALGFTHVLTKPVVINELLSLLSAYLNPDAEVDFQDVAVSASEGLDEPEKPDERMKILMSSEQGKRLIKKFVDKLPETMRSIEVAMSSRDIEALKDIFHQLKGVGGSVGFHNITQLSKEIEVHIANLDYDRINDKVNEFFKICEHISNTA